MKRTLPSMLFVFLMLLALFRSPLPVAAAGWTIETVATAGDVGQSSSLVLDASNNPHISFYNATGGSLFYASKSAGIWTVEKVGSNGGNFSSIAMNASGIPQIAYRNDSDNSIDYAYKAMGTWHIETVETAALVAFWTSIALDSLGLPHISYQIFFGEELHYASRVGGVWSAEWVNGTETTQGYTSLALGPSNIPHMTYIDLSTGDLKYANKTGGTWHIATADNLANPDKYSSIAVNSSGKPHIAYYSAAGSKAYYTVQSGNSFPAESLGSASGSVSLALSNTGIASVAFYKSGELVYATRSGGTWTSEVVDLGVSDVGKFASLKLDSSGLPHIAYYDATNGDLKYASKLPPTPPTTALPILALPLLLTAIALAVRLVRTRRVHPA